MTSAWLFVPAYTMVVYPLLFSVFVFTLALFAISRWTAFKSPWYATLMQGVPRCRLRCILEARNLRHNVMLYAFLETCTGAEIGKVRKALKLHGLGHVIDNLPVNLGIV